MTKFKLLYVSPFPPQKSGISDYSIILIYGLRERFKITLLTDDYKLTDERLYEDFEVLRYGKQKIDFNQYDYIIYNIGNNPYFHSFIYELCLEHPGLVILHDCVLYYLIVGYYGGRNQVYSKIYEIGGSEALACIKNVVKHEKRNLLDYKEIAAKLPLNRELAVSGNKIMVHSQYAYQMIRTYTEHVRQIPMIQQVAEDFRVIAKDVLFDKYKIPKGAFVISSFGAIAETKLNHVACQVIKRLAGLIDKPLCYVMVGEGNYADPYLDNTCVYKTGYVTMDEFDSMIVHSDIILNLRYPSMGETSAALIKILQMGKPCIINKGGWFSEIPNDCAIKLPVENIEQELETALKQYILDEDMRQEIANNARRYIEENYATEKIVKAIADFLDE